ncbi:OsmC family protein [Georgenia yuyongxinii]
MTTTAIDTKPQLASFDVSGVWQGGLNTRVEARQFTLVVDEPPAIGGADDGANPIEYVLASLSGCVTVVIRTVAAELGVEVGAVETQASGTLDLRGFLGTADVSPHFQHLDLGITLSTTATAEQLAELQSRVAARCPLLNLVKDAGVDVRETWSVRDA